MNVLAVRDLADEIRRSDVVVVGSGVAGLSAALGMAPRSVSLLTKAELGTGGSSAWAQGGVAAAMAEGDTAAEHAADTRAAGAGLCDPEVVAALTAEGPERLRQLIALGARFDREASGELSLGQEGATDVAGFCTRTATARVPRWSGLWWPRSAKRRGSTSGSGPSLPIWCSRAAASSGSWPGTGTAG